VVPAGSSPDDPGPSSPSEVEALGEKHPANTNAMKRDELLLMK
jgi:hypothetical protein